MSKRINRGVKVSSKPREQIIAAKVENSLRMQLGKFQYCLNLSKESTCVKCKYLVSEIENHYVTLAECRQDKDFEEMWFKKTVCSKFSE